MREYYVYIYIDPRNFEIFYIGKGKGCRKDSHLTDTKETDKVNRINKIKKCGLEPIIRVVARNLTEDESFLVEKTLIWNSKGLTNISTGYYSDNFRPNNTLHENLNGFDYKNGIYYVNVGEGNHRNWDDCLKYGFLSAGQATSYSKQIISLEVGDIIIAYLKRSGYVGVGKVKNKAVKINEFLKNGKKLNEHDLKCKNMFENSDNEKSEYIVGIDWIKSFDRKNAAWEKKKGLYTTQLIKASLTNQKETIEFIEDKFNIKLSEYLD
jgi:uncharacterized protein